MGLDEISHENCILRRIRKSLLVGTKMLLFSVSMKWHRHPACVPAVTGKMLVPLCCSPRDGVIYHAMVLDGKPNTPIESDQFKV